MDRRAFVASTVGAVFALSSDLLAQSQEKIRRIGYLSPFARADVEPQIRELRTELEKLGWTDGQNIALLMGTADGENARLPSVARELIAERPDLILVQGTPATRALMHATKSIPVVMVGVGNPLENGIVADYRKPGGNVTGASYLADESIGKLLQLLKEAAPRLRSVAVFVNPSNEAAAEGVKQIRAHAAASGIQAQVVEVAGKSDFEPAFAAIRNAKTESLLLIPESLIRSNRGAIADFAQTHGLPLAVVGSSRYLPASGLIAFGPTSQQYARLAARYVDQILKGAKPGDLPVEQPAQFELVINLKTAKALGLTIPQSLLQRADEVIQ